MIIQPSREIIKPRLSDIMSLSPINVSTRKTLSTNKSRIASSFRISSLNLTAWLEGGNYNGTTGTWAASASAGTSGSHSFSNAGSTKPTVGTSQGGFSSVSFVAASAQFLQYNATVATFLTASAYTTWAIVKQSSFTGASAKTAGYNNGAIWSDSASYWAQCTSSTNSGVAQVYQWDGAGKGQEAALSNAVWTLIQSYYDGSNLGIRTIISGGANSGWVTGAAGNIQALTGTFMYMGSNYNGVRYYDGLILDAGLSQVAYSQAVQDNIKSALNSKYGLSF